MGIVTLFSPYPQSKYRSGEVIIPVGAPPAEVFYLKSGLVRQSAVSPSGEIFIIHLFRPGSFFPMARLSPDLENNFEFTAYSPVIIHKAPLREVENFLKHNPQDLWDFNQRLLQGLAGISDRVGTLVLNSAYHRVISVLLYFAKNFGRQHEDLTVIEIPMAHRELAAWIGTSRETASIQIETLGRKGLLESRNRKIILKDIAMLRAELANKI